MTKETTETWGVITFYGLTGVRGIDGLEDVATIPWQLGRFFIAHVGTGHAFVNFHKYKKITKVFDDGRKDEVSVEELTNNTHGYYPAHTSGGWGALTGTTGEFHEDSEMLGILQRGKGTVKDYAAYTYFVKSNTEWDAAKSRMGVWKAKNEYTLMTRDCASYTLDVARAASLKVPIRNRMLNTIPYQAINMLALLNPEDPATRKPMTIEVRDLQ